MAVTNCPQASSVIQNCRKSTRTSAAPRASTKEDTSHDPTNADPLETPETDWHGGCRATTTGTGRGTLRRAAFIERLSLLVEHEQLSREQRKQARLVKQARLKLQATVQEVDYQSARNLERSQVANLAQESGCAGARTCSLPALWLRKNLPACALGYQACQQGHSTLLLPAAASAT